MAPLRELVREVPSLYNLAGYETLSLKLWSQHVVCRSEREETWRRRFGTMQQAAANYELYTATEKYIALKNGTCSISDCTRFGTLVVTACTTWPTTCSLCTPGATASSTQWSLHSTNGRILDRKQHSPKASSARSGPRRLLPLLNNGSHDYSLTAKLHLRCRFDYYFSMDACKNIKYT